MQTNLRVKSCSCVLLIALDDPPTSDFTQTVFIDFNQIKISTKTVDSKMNDENGRITETKALVCFFKYKSHSKSPT